jgi:hypothetical protein
MLSGDLEPRVVEIKDSQSKVFLVSITIGTVLDEFDLVVGAFQRSRRDGMVVPRQQTRTVLSQCLRHRVQHPDARRLGLTAP